MLLSSHHIQVGHGSTSPNNHYLLNVNVWNGLEKEKALRAYLVERQKSYVWFPWAVQLFPISPTPHSELLSSSSSDSLQEVVLKGTAEPLSCPVVWFPEALDFDLKKLLESTISFFLTTGKWQSFHILIAMLLSEKYKNQFVHYSIILPKHLIIKRLTRILQLTTCKVFFFVFLKLILKLISSLESKKNSFRHPPGSCHNLNEWFIQNEI